MIVTNDDLVVSNTFPFKIWKVLGWLEVTEHLTQGLGPAPVTSLQKPGCTPGYFQEVVRVEYRDLEVFP